MRAVNIPVTLKTRLGYHDGQPVITEVARIAEACGIAALAVHGRSRAQRYQGEADYATIAAAKAKTRLPVIANGDIKSAEQAKTLLDRYGFDGIMIDIPAAAKNTQIHAHLRDLHQHYGAQATAIARKHLHAYLRPHPDYPALRPAINHAAHLDAQLALIPR